MTTGWQLQFLTDYQNIPSYEPFLTPNWWRKFFDDTTFRNKVYARWQNVKSNIINTQIIYGYIDSLTTLLDESKTRNFEKWPVLGVWVWPNYYVGQTYHQEISYLKNWIAYRLNWMDNNMIGEPTDVEEYQSEIPSEFRLEQNYPNPFNPSTNISWQLPSPSNVIITLHNSLGEEVETVVSEYMSAGFHSKLYNVNSTLPSGVYFYRMQAGDFMMSRKMILLK